ncbi:iron(III) transport system permease protein [Thermocatellispora tengchongensis]|uniref:Iron(III) transport system permease protein n=1 Tax=Thermocatellispora tengchongensis TaxID=1073253 RepID=A0A840P5B4_9ACTN|nr:iron ABC transporter permease [Thermocatellispora tengchongensis]MBB5132407.1 iron(III) transport system permease protein [Thermocatellispora tengchongensis]
MTVTAEPRPGAAAPGSGRTRRPRRRFVPATAGHYLIWIVTLVVVVGPVVPITLASFWSTPLYRSGGHLTLGNFRDLLTDPAWWSAVGNSAAFAALTTVSSVLFGVGAAVLLTRTNVPFRRLFAGVLILPVMLPGLVLIVGWMAMWAPSGYVSSWLEINTVLWFPVDLYTLPGMALVATTVAAPTVFLFCRTTVLAIDPALEDAARSAGAHPLRALVSVTVPLLRPAVLNSALLVFAVSFEVLGLPLILGFSNDITFVSTYLYDNWINAAPPNQGLVSAGAVFLLLCVSGLLVLRNRLVGDVSRYTTVTGKATGTRVVDLGPVRWPLAAVFATVLGVLVVVPLAGVVMSAFTSILTPYITPWSVLTTANFAAIAGNPIWSESIVNSLLIAGVGGLLATAAIAVVSVVAHRSAFRFRGSLQQAVVWPRMMPGLVTGMAFFWSFAILDPSGAVRGSLWGIGLAFAVRSLALGYGVFYPALAAIGEDLDRAARTSGATWWQASVSVVLRLSAPAMAACFVLLFVSMLNDADPAVFLVTDRTPVMGLTMLQLAATSTGGAVAAFGVIQMVITLAVLAAGRIFLGVRAHA